jgi:hypothetical protein
MSGLHGRGWAASSHGATFAGAIPLSSGVAQAADEIWEEEVAGALAIGGVIH